MIERIKDLSRYLLRLDQKEEESNGVPELIEELENGNDKVDKESEEYVRRMHERFPDVFKDGKL